MFAPAKSKETPLLTLAEATKVLEECRRMVTAQRETFQRHLDEGRKVVEKSMKENRHLDAQLALTRADNLVLQQQNTKLVQHNDSLNKQLAKAPKQSSGVRNLILRILGSSEGLDDNEIEKRLLALLTEYGNKLKSLRADQQDLQAKLKDSTSQLTSSRNELAKRDPLIVQSAEAIKDELEKNKILAKRVCELETELAGRTEGPKRLEDDKNMLGRLQNENSNSLNQAKTAAMENAELRASVKRLKDDVAFYKAQVTATKERDEVAIKSLEDQIKQGSEELEKVKVKHEMTRQMLEFAVKNVQELNQDLLNAAENEAHLLRLALKEEQERSGQLEASIMNQKVDPNCKYTRKGTKGMTTRIKSLENTEKQLRKSMANKNNHIATLKAQLADMSRREPHEAGHPTPSPSPSIPVKRPRRR